MRSFQPDLVCGNDGCVEEFTFDQAELEQDPRPALIRIYDHWEREHPGVSTLQLHDNERFLCAGCRTRLNEVRGRIFTDSSLSRACPAGGEHSPYPRKSR